MGYTVRQMKTRKSKDLSANDVERYREELAKLPIGSISRKTIAGKVRYYRQWVENGRTRSEYLKESEVDGVRRQIERRRELAKMLRAFGEGKRSSSMRDLAMKTGRELSDWADFVSGWDFRDVFPNIMKFLRWPAESKVLIVFGIRRTGKTTMLQQAVRALTREEFAKAAYIKVRTGDTLETMDDRLSRLRRRGFRYVFIDEVTLIDDFIDGASLFSDVYAPMGMKIVLSGTDSLGFRMSIDQELFDRAYMLHTSFVPFGEYSRLLGIDDIDEYISYGGLLRRGEKNLDDPLANEPEASFRDEESTRRYIDTAIARNIQHSLACCRDGRYFGALRELYEKDELTNAINRVIEDMNHEFLASVLTRPFKSSDLGIASRQLMTDREAARRRRLDRMLDKGAVTAELMRYLDVRNSDSLRVKVSDAHAAAIKAYLGKLDLIRDCPVKMLRGKSIEDGVRVLFSQPGMRYCQAEALVRAMMKDSSFAAESPAEQEYVTGRILDDVRGRMLEDIVLLETLEAAPRPRGIFAGMEVFKLQFESGEFDMVIQDLSAGTCSLYEVKHSSERADEQFRHLVDSKLLSRTERAFGKITARTVLYRGPDFDHDSGISYRNVEGYLKGLRNRQANGWVQHV